MSILPLDDLKGMTVLCRKMSELVYIARVMCGAMQWSRRRDDTDFIFLVWDSQLFVSIWQLSA